MIGELTCEKIERLLHQSVIGHLGCSDGQMIYVVPISYAYDGSYVYCHTHEGLKVDILRHHPNVCFQVEHLDDLANWQSVIAHGDFEELTDPEEKLDGLNKLHARHLPHITSQTTRLTSEWPFESGMLGEIGGVTFRVRLGEKTGRFEMSDESVQAFF